MGVRDNSAGFSLIETLVALGVFSIAAISLVHLGSETTQGARHVGQRFLAGVEADNLMAEALVSPARIPDGLQAGQSTQRGHAFDWQRTVSPAGQADLLVVIVNVADPESGQVLAERRSLMVRAQ